MSTVTVLRRKLADALRSGDHMQAAEVRAELDRLAGRNAGKETR